MAVKPLVGSNTFQYPLDNLLTKDRTELPSKRTSGMCGRPSRWKKRFPLA